MSVVLFLGIGSCFYSIISRGCDCASYIVTAVFCCPSNVLGWLCGKCRRQKAQKHNDKGDSDNDDDVLDDKHSVQVEERAVRSSTRGSRSKARVPDIPPHLVKDILDITSDGEAHDSSGSGSGQSSDDVQLRASGAVRAPGGHNLRSRRRPRAK